MAGGKWFVASLLLALAGCVEEKPPEPSLPAGAPTELASAFDAAATGTLEGQITWQGPIPRVPALEVYADLESQPGMPRRGRRANPHAPQVNERNRGVAQAVVYLRQVDPRKSRPWDHEPVHVELSDWQINVRQGPALSAIGFVRRGTTFQAVSKQKVLHVLRADGAAFLSLPLPDPEVASTRPLERGGHVELSSGADYFWMRAHLFVDEHPYYAHSDADGKFVLPSVPAGTYQVVCWLPNWNVAWRERNAESALICRIGYHRPLEKPASATVRAGGPARVDFVVAEEDFARR